MPKCRYKNCYGIPDIGSYYCLEHRISIIKDLRKKLHEIPDEQKELLK